MGEMGNPDVDPMGHSDRSAWGPVRGKCFDRLGFALLYMDFLACDDFHGGSWPKDQRDRVIALCREVATMQHEPTLSYWQRMLGKIDSEVENMC